MKRATLLKMIVMLVITLVMIIIAIWMCSCQALHYNEKLVISSLMDLQYGEISFLMSCHIDQDRDGYGEYGLLNELTGNHSIRGKDAILGNPNYYDYIYANTHFRVPNSSGYATANGYHFQIYLPHVGQPVTDSDKKLQTSKDSESIDAQEIQFILYAWPVKAGHTGDRCFVLYEYYGVKTSGVKMSANRRKDGTYYYSGSNTPSYNSAMPADKEDIITSVKWAHVEDDKIAIDGQIWERCGVQEVNRARAIARSKFYKFLCGK